MAGARRSGTQAKGERETRTRAERLEARLPTGMASCGDESVMRPSGVMKAIASAAALRWI